MKKLKLNLDEIKVDSFEIPNSRKRGGTVRGYDDDTVGWGLSAECCDASNDDSCTLGCTGNAAVSECECPSGNDRCIVTGLDLCTYETEC